jgi:hypothetical protein
MASRQASAVLDFGSRMTRIPPRLIALATVVAAAAVGRAVPAAAFAVLAHEAIIDDAWNEAIRDLVVAQLVLHLAKHDLATVDCGLRTDVLAFYADRHAPIATKRDRDEWAEVGAAVGRLCAGGAGRCEPDEKAAR